MKKKNDNFSIFKRKRVSILGDSISTLKAWNPQGYNVFYKGYICKQSGVANYSDTWWGQVIEFLGGKLLANNSWSGSRVTKLPSKNVLFPSGCSIERINGLSKGKKKPDVIFVELGDNDWARGVDLSFEGNMMLEESFYDAYQIMLSKIKNEYPFADVYCLNLFSTYIPENSSFIFPRIYHGHNIEDYNKVIGELAIRNGFKLIDIYSNNINISTIDGSHPDQEGMATLAKIIIKEIMR